MAKSLRSKRKKRLRSIRRDMVQPLYEKKEAAKLVAQETALAAPKLPVRLPKPIDDAIEAAPPPKTSSSSALPMKPLPASAADMDVEMTDGGSSLVDKSFLKPAGGIGKKKLKKKLKKSKQNKGKGSIQLKHKR